MTRKEALTAAADRIEEHVNDYRKGHLSDYQFQLMISRELSFMKFDEEQRLERLALTSEQITERESFSEIFTA